MIYTFDPQIYPRLLWIQIGTEIPEGFSGVERFYDSCDAMMDCCLDANNNKGGVLLRFRYIENMTVSTITHEAVHAAIVILRYCGIRLDPDNSEVICYLAGWAAKCCDEVAKSELEKRNCKK